MCVLKFGCSMYVFSGFVLRTAIRERWSLGRGGWITVSVALTESIQFYGLW